MKKNTIVILLVVTFIVVGGTIWFFEKSTADELTENIEKEATSKTENTAANDRSIADGSALFTQYCATCHGDVGQGENPAKKGGGKDENGNYIAPALDSSAHAWHHPDDVLFNYIQNGSPDQASTMRGFKDKMSDEEMYAVLVFVKSLWSPKILNMRNR